MISSDEALKKVLSTGSDFGSEKIPILESIGRILAIDIRADRDFPPFDRVAMDGIAINVDYKTVANHGYKIDGIGAAGSPRQELLDPSNCIEIMTGAPLPIGTNAVVRYEDLHENDESTYSVLTQVTPMQNVHLQGGDSKKGEILLSKGQRIKAIDINVLASVGQSIVEVKRMPKVAVISSGDELIDIDKEPLDHQIRKSNVYMLRARLSELNIDSNAFHFADNREDIELHLESVLNTYDVVLMSGGVSKGKFDFIPEALEKMGVKKIFHKVAQRPGKPFWFGQKGVKCVFAFPGNPVSTLACFHKYFIPWLYRCLDIEYRSLKVSLAQDIEFKPDLTYFAQASIQQEDDGVWVAKVRHGNGSGDMVSPSQMNGFVELPKGHILYPKGMIVNFLAFTSIV